MQVPSTLPKHAFFESGLLANTDITIFHRYSAEIVAGISSAGFIRSLDHWAELPSRHSLDYISGFMESSPGLTFSYTTEF